MSGILMMSVGNSYGSLPVNTVAPVVSGTATVGSTLTTTNGTWTGAPTPTFTYQWQRNTSNISGATSSTYVVQLADVGFTLRCVVTGTNSVGSASANSNSTATVASPYWASFLASPSDVLRTYDNVRDSSNNLYSVGVIGGTTGGGFVTKYNSAGALLWQRLINDTSSPGQFNARGVAVDSSGNVYVVGSWASVGHIIKFDPSGNVIFRKQTGGIGTAFFERVAIDSANNICIGGYTVPYYAAALVVKATSAGAPTWARSYSETEAVPKGTVAVDSSDNVYFTSERSDNGRRMRLFKLNSSGTQQWARTLNGGSNTDVIMEDLATDSSGNVYVSGRTDYQSFGGIDVILAKWNTSGVFQWQRRLGGSSSDIAYALAVSPAGDVFVGGQFISGGNKGLVARYNTSGTIQWQRSVLWRTSTDIRGMSLDGSSAFYVSGVGTAGTTYSVTNAYLPQDGSRTGSYTDFTYSASSLSEAAGTLFEASWSGSVGNVSGLTLNDSTVLTVTTPTFTSTLTNV